MAARKRIVRREWSKADLRELETMARACTPAKSIGRSAPSPSTRKRHA